MSCTPSPQAAEAPAAVQEEASAVAASEGVAATQPEALSAAQEEQPAVAWLSDSPSAAAARARLASLPEAGVKYW